VHQICSTTRKRLRAVRQDVQGREGRKEAAPITMFLPRKQKQ